MRKLKDEKVKYVVKCLLEGEKLSDVLSNTNESIVTEPDGTKSVLVVFPKHSPHLPFIHNGERCHAQIVDKVPEGNYVQTAFTAPGYTVYVNRDEVNKDMQFNPYAFIAIKDKKSRKVTEDTEIDIDKLCDKADVELKRLIKWLKDNEEAFKVQDLKLYSAAFYDFDKKFPLIKKACDDGFYENDYDPFYDFCNAEYDNFIDWCSEQGIDFQKMTKAVWGSNSKFYLYKDELIELEGNRGKEYGIRLQTTIDNFVDYFGYESSFEADENGLVDRDYVKDWYESDEYVTLNLKDIVSGSLYTDVTDYYEDVIKVYEYIQDVKENQVHLFEEWLENETEFIKDQYPEITEED